MSIENEQPPAELVAAPDATQMMQMLGFDTQRLWVTGVQVFVTGETTLIVLREQFDATLQDGKSETIMRNVGSLVMPTELAKEMAGIINSLTETRGGQD